MNDGSTLNVTNAQFMSNNTIIHHTYNNAGYIGLTNATLTITSDTPLIKNECDGDLYLNNCELNSVLQRTGAMIEIGSSTQTVNSSLVIEPDDGKQVLFNNYYYYAIRAYTTGSISTGLSVMNAAHTNILWDNLADLFTANNLVPYSCDNSFNYVAYSHDPTTILQLTHESTGMKLGSNTISNYDMYAAVGYLNTVGDSADYVATLNATSFTDLCGNTITDTNKLNNIFTSSIFNNKYYGSINNTNTQTLSYDQTHKLKKFTLSFADTTGIYLGPTTVELSFDSILQTFSYEITESSSDVPVFSITGADNSSGQAELSFNVIDTVSTEQTITYNLTQKYGLPLYIIPNNSSIISLFQFKNTDNSYVSYDTYSAYPNSVNKTKLQKINANTTTYNFIMKYIGNNIYYEPTNILVAHINLSLYSDNINETLVNTSSDIIIYNITPDVSYPLSYIGVNPSINNTVTLNSSSSTNTEIGTFGRPSSTSKFNEYYIEYSFTLKYKMPLITFSTIDNHKVHIKGIDLNNTGNISFGFTNASAGTTLYDPSDSLGDGTFAPSTPNSCVIKYSGTDVDEHTIDVTVRINDLGDTTGDVYFKKENHQIQFELNDITKLKGFNSTGFIQITGATQTANSYFNFPKTVLVGVNINDIDNDTYTTYTTGDHDFAITKGDTQSITIFTAGKSQSSITIPLTITTDISGSAMPYTLTTSESSITIDGNSYYGSKSIQFGDNHLISGSDKKYSVSFDQTNYSTVNKITFTDSSREHIIYYRLAIYPLTRVRNLISYLSNNKVQAPTGFNASSDSTALTPSITPSSYNICFPIGVLTDFIPYNTTTGATSSFRVNYVLYSSDDNSTPKKNLLTKGTHYEMYESNLTTTTENSYVTINDVNYDQTQYVYIKLEGNISANPYINVYSYYSSISGTDMVNVPAVSSATALFVGQYDFSNAPATATNSLNVNIGSWKISTNANSDLVFTYNGGLNNDDFESVGSVYTIPAPTTIVTKTITTE